MQTTIGCRFGVSVSCSRIHIVGIEYHLVNIIIKEIELKLQWKSHPSSFIERAYRFVFSCPSVLTLRVYCTLMTSLMARLVYQQWPTTPIMQNASGFHTKNWGMSLVPLYIQSPPGLIGKGPHILLGQWLPSVSCHTPRPLRICNIIWPCKIQESKRHLLSLFLFNFKSNLISASCKQDGPDSC